MTAEAVRARARELDDGMPLDRCPGCGAPITIGFPTTHPDARLEQDLAGPITFCAWRRDYLVARSMRRHIARGGDL